MDELKNTPELNDRPKEDTARSVSLDEMLKWADQAIDSLEHPKKKQPEPEEPQPTAEADAQAPAEPDARPQEQAAPEPPAQEPPQAQDAPNLEPSAAGDKAPEAPAHGADEDPDDEEDLDYNDDELLRGYVWDEETGKLYKVKEPGHQPVLTSLFLAALALIAAGSILLNKAPLLPASKTYDNSILSDQQQPQEDAPQLPADQQQVQGEATVQYIPAEIISDGKVIAVMASTEAAHALLEDTLAYFNDSITGEGTKETIFEDPVEVRPLPNGTDSQISTYDELFARFTSSSSPLKVRTTLTLVQTEIIPFDTETKDHPTLIEGTRIVASLGREGSETTRSRTVYINGDRSTSRSGTDTETIKPMDMLIYEGEEKPDLDEDSPGRHEGERGPDQQDLTFIDPIEGDISCNFGQLYGVLHLGLDYEPESNSVLASAPGTVVTLMERGGYGLMLEIDHGSGFVTRYAHLHSASVALGDRVEQGQVIATAGQTGNVDETTLHFEIRVDGLAYNPRYYLD